MFLIELIHFTASRKTAQCGLRDRGTSPARPGRVTLSSPSGPKSTTSCALGKPAVRNCTPTAPCRQPSHPRPPDIPSGLYHRPSTAWSRLRWSHVEFLPLLMRRTSRERMQTEIRHIADAP